MKFDPIGKPFYFDIELIKKCIDQYMKIDEVRFALQMCDMLPAHLRENPPSDILNIKKKIYQRTYDQIEYATDDEEANCKREFGEDQWHSIYCFPRAQIVEDALSELNKNGIIPWIYDLGCSHGNLPLGLLKFGFKFKYFGRGMNYRIVEKLKGWLGDVWAERPEPGQPTILTCFETLEHCFNPHDLVHSSYKVGVDFDQIFLSTPKGTLGGGLPEWDNRRVGHVRTWNLSEFLEFAQKSWPGYKWQYFDAYSMVLKGVK